MWSRLFYSVNGNVKIWFIQLMNLIGLWLQHAPHDWPFRLSVSPAALVLICNSHPALQSDLKKSKTFWITATEVGPRLFTSQAYWLKSLTRYTDFGANLPCLLSRNSTTDSGVTRHVRWPLSKNIVFHCKACACKARVRAFSYPINLPHYCNVAKRRKTTK